MVSLIPAINLPLPILIHALGLCTLGLHLTFSESKSPPPHQNSESDSTVLGIATLGLGLSYLSTSYMAQTENQLLYASVPVRMILAAIAGVKLAVLRGKDVRWRLWGILLYDGLGGLVLGWWLGSWRGRVPAYQ